MAESALIIARVSADKQRPEDQRDGLIAYANRKNYHVAELLQIRGKSAFHGRHRKTILAAITKHVRESNITVVVFRHIDRMSRLEPEDGMRFYLQLRDMGVRIEFSEQEAIPFEMLGLFLKLAHDESKIKQDRKLQGNTVKRAKGELVGKAPWGYDAVIVNDIQVNIIPNALGLRWIPFIFTSVTQGKSLRWIAEALRGTPSPQKNNLWDQTSLRRIIANTTYYGAMKGNPNLIFEALVSVDLHKQANIGVESRIKHGRSTVKHEAPLAKPVCGACYGLKRDGAPSGHSPMYVVRKTDKYGVWVYYRCTGHGPGRKSCGAPLIRADVLNDAINSIMASDTRAHMTTEVIAGDDNDERRSSIKAKMSVALESDDDDLLMRLRAELKQIGPSERKAGSRTVDSGITVGKHWETLSLPEKRDELLRWTVIASPEGVKILGPWHGGSQTLIGAMIEEAEEA